MKTQENDNIQLTIIEPAKAIFFTAGIISLIVNIFIVYIIRYGISQGTIDSNLLENTYPWMYVIAILLGIRHFLRVDEIDVYIKNEAIDSNSRKVYWAIFLGTFFVTVSFTVTIFSAKEYFLILIPYFIIFIMFEIYLIVKTTKASNDIKYQFLTVLVDVLFLIVIWAMYSIFTGNLKSYDTGFFIILIISIIVFVVELVKVYGATLGRRWREAGVLLFKGNH